MSILIGLGLSAAGMVAIEVLIRISQWLHTRTALTESKRGVFLFDKHSLRQPRRSVIDATEDLLSVGGVLLGKQHLSREEFEAWKTVWLSASKATKRERALRALEAGSDDVKQFGLRELRVLGYPEDVSRIQEILLDEEVNSKTRTLAEKVVDVIRKRQRMEAPT